MDLPTRRERTFVEVVIAAEGPQGIDAKTFHQSYHSAVNMIREDGVDVGYDDAFFVTVRDDEIVFTYEKKAQAPA